MTRLVVVLALGLIGCGASSKKRSNSPTTSSWSGPQVGPHDDVGDVVTGSMSAPQSPGINGPSVPGGPGAGGGTQRPR